jgi:hypothetical protein
MLNSLSLSPARMAKLANVAVSEAVGVITLGVRVSLRAQAGFYPAFLFYKGEFFTQQPLAAFLQQKKKMHTKTRFGLPASKNGHGIDFA